jgi:hypothetical protein
LFTELLRKSSSRKLGGQGRWSKPLPPPKIRDIDYPIVGKVFSGLLGSEERHDQELMSHIDMTLSEEIRMLSGADFLEPLSEQQLEKFAEGVQTSSTNKERSSPYRAKTRKDSST